MDHDFREAIATARRQGTLYFAALLPEERIRQAFGSASWFWKTWLYSPTITLWVFLAQCTSADHSCVAAVAQLIRWRISRGLKPCSAQTGGYCQARDRLWFASISCVPTDFRTGRRVGPGDHCVRWPKPARPKWMSAEQYESLPAELEMREVRVVVRQKGFRTQELIVVTTLLDAQVYTSEELAKRYRRRWQAELNIRSLKIVMQMDHLRCQTPHRVRNEFYMHLVANNLIRQVMVAAAQHAGREPWMVSFKGALQTLDAMLSLLVESQNSIDVGWEAMLDAIASHKVGHRPDRYGPRVKKRRPKKYKLMREPRENNRKRMAA